MQIIMQIDSNLLFVQHFEPTQFVVEAESFHLTVKRCDSG